MATSPVKMRTPQEVFQHHAEALGTADLKEIVADYRDDAVFITPRGVRRGKEGVREAFARLLDDQTPSGISRPSSTRATSSSWNGELSPGSNGSRTGSTPSSSTMA